MLLMARELIQGESARTEALETLRAGLYYFRGCGFTPWEIARKLARDMTPGQMRRTVATLSEIAEVDVAHEMDRLADRAEREAEEAEQERRKRERVDDWYICDGDGAILDIMEDASYAYALFHRDDVAEQLDIDPESLDVLSAGEYEERYGEDA